MDLDRARRSSLVYAVVLAFCCVLGFWLVFVLTVTTTSGRLFSDASLRGAGLGRDSTATLVDNALGVVTVASLAAAVALVAVVALLRLRRGLGLAAILLLTGANVSAQVLKEWVLQRPDLGLRESTPATLNSLPSGHAAAAFSVVVALLLVLPPRVRPTVAVAGGGYAGVVAFATMIAGWHRAADAIASFLLVGLCAAVAAAGVVLFPGDTGSAGPGAGSGGRRYRRLLQGSGLALAGAVVLMVTWLGFPSLQEDTLGLVVAFVSSALFVAGSLVVLLVLVVLLFDRVDPALREEIPVA